MAQLIHPIMANGAITNGTAESARLEYFAMGLQPTNHRKKRGAPWREIEGFGVVDRKRSRKLGLAKS